MATGNIIHPAVSVANFRTLQQIIQQKQSIAAATTPNESNFLIIDHIASLIALQTG
jgi:hypothetical protein